MPFLQEKSNLSGEFITPSRGIKVHLKRNIFQCNLTLFQHRDEVLLMAIGFPLVSIDRTVGRFENPRVPVFFDDHNSNSL